MFFLGEGHSLTFGFKKSVARSEFLYNEVHKTPSNPEFRRVGHSAVSATSIYTQKYHQLVIFKGFFDHMNHEWILKFVGYYIQDPNMLNLINKFLKGGILEEGDYKESWGDGWEIARLTKLQKMICYSGRCVVT